MREPFSRRTSTASLLAFSIFVAAHGIEGCSSSSNDTADGGGDCAAACAHENAANCSAGQTDCASTCAVLNANDWCASQFAAAWRCSASAQVVCDQKGSATVPACAAQNAAADDCIVHGAPTDAGIGG